MFQLSFRNVVLLLIALFLVFSVENTFASIKGTAPLLSQPQNEASLDSALADHLEKFDLAGHPGEVIEKVQVRLLNLRAIVQKRRAYMENIVRVLKADTKGPLAQSLFEGADASIGVESEEFFYNNFPGDLEVLIYFLRFFENQLAELIEKSEVLGTDSSQAWLEEFQRTAGDARTHLLVFRNMIWRFTPEVNLGLDETLESVVRQRNEQSAIEIGEKMASELKFHKSRLETSSRSEKGYVIFDENEGKIVKQRLLRYDNPYESLLYSHIIDCEVLLTGFEQLAFGFSIEIKSSNYLNKISKKVNEIQNRLRDAHEMPNSDRVDKRHLETLKRFKQNYVAQLVAEMDPVVQARAIDFRSLKQKEAARGSSFLEGMVKSKSACKRPVTTKKSRLKTNSQATQAPEPKPTMAEFVQSLCEEAPQPSDIEVKVEVIEPIRVSLAESSLFKQSAKLCKDKANMKHCIGLRALRLEKMREDIRKEKSLPSKAKQVQERRNVRIFERILLNSEDFAFYKFLIRFGEADFSSKGRNNPSWNQFVRLMNHIFIQTGGKFKKGGQTTGSARTIYVGNRSFVVHEPHKPSEPIPDEYIEFIKSGFQVVGLWEDSVQEESRK